MKFFAAFVIFVLVSCGSPTDKKGLKIACAANMQFAMDSIAVLFENEFGIHCDITSGSSGMLTSQIENGAPYDIFVSANMSYPKTVFGNGNGQKPIIYAKGRLIFVTRKTDTYPTIDAALNDLNLLRIGMADKILAPYGMATNQYLKSTGKSNMLETRLVVGESIGQVNQYLKSDAVDAAFTSYSFKVKNKNQYNYFEVDQQFFDPINQGAMILNHGVNNNLETSEKLLKFFSNEKCKAILEYFGYLTD